MKRISLIIVALFCTIQFANAQSKHEAASLELFKQEGNIMLHWISDKDLADTEYWEVQASANNKDFKTVGLVWGANPATEGKYQFKQNATKMPGKLTYYRVLRVNTTVEAVSSQGVRLAK